MAPGPSPEMPRNKLRETGFVSGWEIGPSMAMPTRPCPRRTNLGQTTLAPQLPHLFHGLSITKLSGLICKASERESSKNSQAPWCVTEPLDAAQAIMTLHRNITRPNKHERQTRPCPFIAHQKRKKKERKK